MLSFKTLTTTQILESIEPVYWFASIDLKDAYFRMPICQDHHPFLRFAFQDRVYQFRVLPFGLSLSPRVFTRVVSAALCLLQCVGLKILAYLDDWLICAPSRNQVMKDTEMVFQHVQALGLKVNWDKSNLNPQQQTVFVGISLDSQLIMASLSLQRVIKLSSVAQSFHLTRRMKLIQFQQLLGMIVVTVIPLGLLRACPLQRWVNSANLHSKLDSHMSMRITRRCILMLRPWKNKRLISQGVHLGNIPAGRSVITTDASLTGWGAVWEGRSVRGFWELPWTLEHINVLELRAVHLSLRALLPLLQNKHVLVRMDNMSAVYHIKARQGKARQGKFICIAHFIHSGNINHQGGTRSAQCLQVTKKLLSWSSLELLSLKAVYIPGVANKAADLLS